MTLPGEAYTGRMAKVSFKPLDSTVASQYMFMSCQCLLLDLYTDIHIGISNYLFEENKVDIKHTSSTILPLNLSKLLLFHHGQSTFPGLRK